MDEKLTLKPNADERYFKGCMGTLLYLLEHREFDEAVQFIGEIYYNGCHAQAVADREAVGIHVVKFSSMLEIDHPAHGQWLCEFDKVIAVLSVAEIKEEK